MKYISVLLFFVLFSCGNKETILLPKSNITLIKEVQDYSPIYLFFKTKEKDTLVEVNRKNSISSTNWIFHIDKRLPLRLVVPEIIKLQAKKEGSAHKSETSENYFSYSDSIHKNLAFMSFTKLNYKMEKPFTLTSFLYFKKDGKVQFYDTNKYDFPKEKLQDFLNNLFIEHESEIIFSFDEDMSYGEYIKSKILIKNLIINKKGIWINQEIEFLY